MAYPVNTKTQAGDPFYPFGFGQIRNRGPYINTLGHRYIFSDPFPIPIPHVIGAFRSLDDGLTWFEQDAANHIVTFHAVGNPSSSNVVCANPSDPALITVFYFSAGGPTPSVLAQDFNIETGLWAGPAYGGLFPFVPGGATNPELFNVVARPVASEFVMLASTTNGTQARAQFVRISPGGGWGPSIDAFPGANATDNVVDLADTTIACTSDESVYAVLERFNTGGSIDDLIQCILSPVNAVTNAVIDANGVVFPTNPLGSYSDVGGYVAANGKIFLVLGFTPTIGNPWVYAGWAAQGGDILFPYNLGVAGIVSGATDAEQPFASLNYGTVFFWWEDAAFTGSYVTLDPAAGTPAVSGINPSAPFLPGSASPEEVNSLGAFVMGALAQISGTSDVGYSEFPFPAGSTLALADSPPSGAIGVPYAHCFIASGGAPPYVSYLITAGALPPGLVLGPTTGCLTGIPTTAGTFCFTVTVTDSAAATASVSPCITIVLTLADAVITFYGWKLYPESPCGPLAQIAPAAPVLPLLVPRPGSPVEIAAPVSARAPRYSNLCWALRNGAVDRSQFAPGVYEALQLRCSQLGYAGACVPPPDVQTWLDQNRRAGTLPAIYVTQADIDSLPQAPDLGGVSCPQSWKLGGMLDTSAPAAVPGPPSIKRAV